MDVQRRFGSRLSCSLLRLGAAACLLAISVTAAEAQSTLYWSGNGTTQGGNGTWDTSLSRWGTVFSGPYATVWSNGNLDTARFGNTAGTATLGANITVGGLWFDTTGYRIDSSTNILSFNGTTSAIVFNNIAAATISGNVSGTGNVTLSTTNPATTGTLTLNGTSTSGWNGTTTINSGMTLALAESNQGLNNTTAITLKGGAITLTNTTANATTNNRVSNAAITSNGGTFTYTNTAAVSAVYAETIGLVDLIGGQTNFVLTTNQNQSSNNQTFTIGGGGLTRWGASNTSAVTFSAGTTGPNTTTNRIFVTGGGNTTAGQIIGPWATTGTAAGSQTDYAVYSSNYVAAAGSSLATVAESGWGSTTSAYQFGTAQTLTADRSAAALRYTAGANSLALAGSTLATNGILNGGSGLLTISGGAGLTATGTSGGYLYLTTGSNAITVNSAINDNGGAVTLVKNGSGGTLTLSSTTSNFTGGVVLNAGQLNTTTDAQFGTGGGLVVNGNATWNADAGAAATLTYRRSVTINDGAVLNVASGNAGKTITGVLSGNGTINNTSSTGFTFTNKFNTFTGTVNNGYQMDFASLGDGGAVNLQGSNSVFNWIGGPAAFANRVFASNASGTVNINNNGSGNLTIQQNLAISGAAGARTLSLAGAYMGANTFAGNIADGAGSVVGVTKAGGGRWVLSGTNTYSGNTTNVVNNPAGSFYFLGMQSVSPNTTINETQGGGSGGNVAWNFLDGSGSPLSRSTVNLVHNQANNSQNVMSVFVGNDSFVNGGTSNSTQTNSVIQLGNMTFTQSSTGAAAGTGLTVTGANGYALRISNVNISLAAAQATAWPVALTANNPLQITGNVTQASGSNGTITLQLGGTSTGSWISGSITNSADGTPRLLSLTKSGAGTWTLNGTNTYNGTTTVSAGRLLFTGNSTSATGNVTVSAGSIGGTGSLGGAVTANSTGGIDLRDSVTGNLTLASTLSITGAAGANNLYFDLGNATNTTDKIIVGGATTVPTVGAAVINLNQLGGLPGRNSSGNYTLIQGTTSMAASGNFSLATTKAFGQTFALGVTGNDLVLTTTQVTPGTGNTTLSGTNPSWQATGNFSGGLLPDYESNVTINSAIGSSTLNGSVDIESLIFGTSATANVTIAQGSVPGGTASNMLFIEARGANGNSAGTGITLNNTSGTHTISANVGLGATQTWALATGGNLTVSGFISDFGGGYGITKAGGGTLTLTGTNSFTGPLVLNAGTLSLGGTSLAGFGSPSSVTFTGNSTVAYTTSGLTLTLPAVEINAGVTAVFDKGTAGGGGAYTFDGALTGNGTLSFASGGSGGGTFTFNNAAAFMGTVRTSSWSTNGSTTLNFSSFGDAGTISHGGTAIDLTVNYTGIADLTFNTRQFVMANSRGMSINNNGLGALVINQPLSVTATGNKTLTLGGNNTATANNFGGLIPDGPSVGVVSLTKSGTGTWTIGNTTNSYTGITTISQGVLSVSTLANATSNSSIGAYGTPGAAGLLLSGGTLLYTGGNVTTNRGFTLTTGSTINVGGDAAANLTLGASQINNSAGILLTVTGSYGSTLTIGAVNNLVNSTNPWTIDPTIDVTISGVISGVGGIARRNGVGSLTLSNDNNSFTGLISTNANSNGGALIFTSISNYGIPSALGNGTSGTAITLGGNQGGSAPLVYIGSGNSTNRQFDLASDASIRNNGTGALTFTGLAADADNFIKTNAGTGNGTRTLTLGGTYTGATNVITGHVINTSAGALVAIAKADASTWALSGNNTYTGATTITGGTLQIGNNGATGSLSTTSAITNNSLLAFNRTNAVTQGTDFNSVIGGTGAVTQRGSDSLILNGSNTYTGATSVQSGRLVAGANAPSGAVGAFGNATGAVLVGNGSTGASDAPSLLIGGTFTVGRAVSLGTVANTNAYNATIGGSNTSGTSTFSGNITLDTTAANYTVTLQAATSGTVDFTTGTWITNNKAIAIGSSGNNGTVKLSNTLATTGGISVNFGTFQLGANDRIGDTTPVTVNGGTLDTASGLTDTVASFTLVSGSVIGTGTISSSTTYDARSGTVAANLAGGVGLTKSTGGSVVLSGSNTYLGTTTVSGGSLLVNGSLASSSVIANAFLGGSGVMGSATVGGSGSVNPGNSPGILTAAATDPTSGLDYNFEFTAANVDPTWGNATASVNDVLRLTSGSPFTASLTSNNTLSVYLNVGSITAGETFTGGFYTDNNADFLTTIGGATFQYYLANVSGNVTYNGVNYDLYTGPNTFTVSTVPKTADFGGGPITGYSTQFLVVPEPATMVLAVCGLLGLGIAARRRFGRA